MAPDYTERRDGVEGEERGVRKCELLGVGSAIGPLDAVTRGGPP